jgi:hypothetical protein
MVVTFPDGMQHHFSPVPRRGFASNRHRIMVLTASTCRVSHEASEV